MTSQETPTRSGRIGSHGSRPDKGPVRRDWFFLFIEKCSIRKTLLILGFLLLVLPCLTSAVQAQDVQGAAYTPVIEGVADKELESLLISVADTFSLLDSPPASLSLLKRRIDRDVPLMMKALRSWGYFKARVETSVENEGAALKAIFSVTTGPAFTLSAIAIEPAEQDASGGFQPPETGVLDLKTGAPFRASAIVDARDRLLAFLTRRGYPFPKVRDTKIIADHALEAVEVTYLVDPGPPAAFGEVIIDGLNTVDEEYVRRLLPWKKGDRFNAALLTDARVKLISTGLFAVANLKKEEIDPDGRLTTRLTVRERKHRTFRTGAGYQTDTGLEGRVEWEHRNLLGAGETLNLGILANEVERYFEANFRKPNFYSEANTLVLNSTLADEFNDAYRSTSFKNTASIERRLNATTTVGLGLSYRLAKIEDNDETFGLLSVPGFVTVDASNDLLDPTEGGRLSVQAAPFTDVRGNTSGFIKARAGYAHYFPLNTARSLVLALRGAYGTIYGGDLEQVPQDELFYAGGGGSVRGYRYQTAGDMKDGEPVGGVGLLELSGELRYRFSRTLGAAIFIDGGRAFSTGIPDPEEDLLWGTGLGFRYYTPIGPLRIDLALPLDRRESQDDAYQIYVSLGQAF